MLPTIMISIMAIVLISIIGIIVLSFLFVIILVILLIFVVCFFFVLVLNRQNSDELHRVTRRSGKYATGTLSRMILRYIISYKEFCRRLCPQIQN